LAGVGRITHIDLSCQPHSAPNAGPDRARHPRPDHRLAARMHDSS
jgi:hypothetical protein